MNASFIFQIVIGCPLCVIKKNSTLNANHVLKRCTPNYWKKSALCTIFPYPRYVGNEEKCGKGYL